jgi:hypothetical protein
VHPYVVLKEREKLGHIKELIFEEPFRNHSIWSIRISVTTTKLGEFTNQARATTRKEAKRFAYENNLLDLLTDTYVP